MVGGSRPSGGTLAEERIALKPSLSLPGTTCIAGRESPIEQSLDAAVLQYTQCLRIVEVLD